MEQRRSKYWVSTVRALILLTVLVAALVSGARWWSARDEVRTKLEAAIAYGRLSEVRELLPEVGNLNYVSFKGITPLTNAIENNDFEAARLLVQAGADVNYSDGADLRPLFYSFLQAQVDISHFLLENGATLSERDELTLSEMAKNNPDLAKKMEGIGVKFSTE